MSIVFEAIPNFITLLSSNRNILNLEQQLIHAFSQFGLQVHCPGGCFGRYVITQFHGLWLCLTDPPHPLDLLELPFLSHLLALPTPCSSLPKRDESRQIIRGYFDVQSALGDDVLGSELS